MILLQIDPPGIALDPLEGNAPRAVDVEAVALRQAVQAMKVEARYLQVADLARLVERIKPASAAPVKVRRNPSALPGRKQLGQPPRASSRTRRPPGSAVRRVRCSARDLVSGRSCQAGGGATKHLLDARQLT